MVEGKRRIGRQGTSYISQKINDAGVNSNRQPRNKVDSRKTWRNHFILFIRGFKTKK